jgi:hypothetical protein
VPCSDGRPSPRTRSTAPKATIDEQLAAYRAFAATSTDDAARTAFEAHFFGNLLLVLGHFFVHRVRLWSRARTGTRSTRSSCWARA